MSDDILDQIDQVVTEHENCPCGRQLPEDCPSFYWCSEACQIAWTAHQHEPAASPHPREIRELQDQIRADGAAFRAACERSAAERNAARRPARRAAEPPTPLSGLDGWAAADQPTAEVCAYLRWCPNCQAKKAWTTVDDTDDFTEPRTYILLENRTLVQECRGCNRRWSGRPLIGEVEQYHGQGFRDLIRLRLRDGYRSATRLIPKRNLQLWREPALMLALEWEHLEETVCDGVTDRYRQERIAGRTRRGPAWDWHGHLMPHVPILPASTTQDIVRITGIP